MIIIYIFVFVLVSVFVFVIDVWVLPGRERERQRVGYNQTFQHKSCRPTFIEPMAKVETCCDLFYKSIDWVRDFLFTCTYNIIISQTIKKWHFFTSHENFGLKRELETWWRFKNFPKQLTRDFLTQSSVHENPDCVPRLQKNPFSITSRWSNSNCHIECGGAWNHLQDYQFFFFCIWVDGSS